MAVRKVDFPAWMEEAIERQAEQLEVPFAAMVKLVLSQTLTGPGSAPVRPHLGPNPAPVGAEVGPNRDPSGPGAINGHHLEGTGPQLGPNSAPTGAELGPARTLPHASAPACAADENYPLFTTGGSRTAKDLTSTSTPSGPSAPPDGATPAKTLSPQQEAVRRVLELFAAYEVDDGERPAPSLVVQWWKRCQRDLPALLARLDEALISGRLQEAAERVPYAAAVVRELAKDLQRGRRPPHAAHFEEARGGGAVMSDGERSFLRSTLGLMRDALAAEGAARDECLGRLRQLYDRAEWEWREPDADTVARLELRLYGPPAEASA